jgi:hypothetical protein
MSESRSKYGNRRVKVNNITFDSQAEARRYGELKLLERAEKLHDLRVHPSFLLQEGFLHQGHSIQPITYIADFSYTEVETGETVVEDVKGVETPEWRLKRKLFLKRHPRMDLRVIKV